MILTGVNRAPVTLLGAAAAGALLWLSAAHVDRSTTGGYWAAYGLVAAAGLAFGLSQLRGGGGHPRAMLVVFLAVLIVAGWVIVGMQPSSNWFARHVRAWSSDIGIGDVVRSLGTWLGVLAFGIGATLAAVVEPVGRRPVRAVSREAEVPAPQPPPEPVPQPDPTPEPEPVGEETLVR
jgi:hypothetical protein